MAFARLCSAAAQKTSVSSAGSGYETQTTPSLFPAQLELQSQSLEVAASEVRLAVFHPLTDPAVLSPVQHAASHWAQQLVARSFGVRCPALWSWVVEVAALLEAVRTHQEAVVEVLRRRRWRLPMDAGSGAVVEAEEHPRHQEEEPLSLSCPKRRQPSPMETLVAQVLAAQVLAAVGQLQGLVQNAMVTVVLRLGVVDTHMLRMALAVVVLVVHLPTTARST